MEAKLKLEKISQKLKKLNMVNVVKHIPNERVRNWILPRLYYYFNLKPTMLMLDVTSKCNSACPFCPRTLQGIRGTNMAPEVFYKAVDEASAMGMRECRLYTTGEPLLHPNIDEFIRYLKRKKFNILISTNGQFLDKHFEALSLCDEVKLSIEGWDKESYEFYRKNCDFEKVQNNLIEFRKYLADKPHKPQVTIGFMIMKETGVPQFYLTWRDKADRIDIYPTSYVFDWDNKESIQYLSFDGNKRLKDNMYNYAYDNRGSKYCSYHFEVATVTANGNGAICCSDFTDSITYGNLKDVSLKSILNHPKRKAGQKQFVQQKLDVCAGCSMFSKMDAASEKDYNAKVKDYVGQ